MSGVEQGGRLERLRRLRAQVDAAIHAEERRLELARPTPPTTRLRGPVADWTLAELGVTSGDVKRWAIHEGLITDLGRGRVPQDLVNQYAAALGKER